MLGLAFNAIVAHFAPAIDDECYYFVWAKQLDWGYFDHPPMVAFFNFLGGLVFNGIWSMRLFPVLLSAILLPLWITILQIKSNREKILLFLLLQAVPLLSVFYFISTPDTFLLFFGSLYVLALQRVIENRSFQNYLFLGIAMAAVMYAKYHGLLLIVFSLIPYFKRFWQDKLMYFAVVVALILYSPHLFWQYQHDWVSIKFHLWERHGDTSFSLRRIIQTVGLIILVTVPIGYPMTSSSVIDAEQKNTFSYNLLWASRIGFTLLVTLSPFVEIQAQWFLFIVLLAFPQVFKYFSHNKTKIYKVLLWASLLFTSLVKMLFAFDVIPNAHLGLKKWAEQLSLDEGYLPVFDRYQKAAAYEFYTGKKAYCLTFGNFRPSQYDLWKNELTLQYQPIVYVHTPYNQEEDMFDSEPPNSEISYIENFNSFPEIQVAVDFSLNGHLLDAQITLTNPSEETIDFKQGNFYQLTLIFFKKSSGKYVFAHVVELQHEYISPTGTLDKMVSVELPQDIFPTGKYFFVVTFDSFGILGKKRTPRIPFEID